MKGRTYKIHFTNIYKSVQNITNIFCWFRFIYMPNTEETHLSDCLSENFFFFCNKKFLMHGRKPLNKKQK